MKNGENNQEGIQSVMSGENGSKNTHGQSGPLSRFEEQLLHPVPLIIFDGFSETWEELMSDTERVTLSLRRRAGYMEGSISTPCYTSSPVQLDLFFREARVGAGRFNYGPSTGGRAPGESGGAREL